MTEMKARLVDKDGNPLGTAANPLKISGDVGGGVPDGGTTGQVLKKKSNTDQDTEWGDSGDPHNLGWYTTGVALNNAFPTANDGDWAIVGSTDSVWIWDTDTTAWVDSGEQALGDMVKSVYDSDDDGVVDAADSVPWSGITDKPSAFAPTSHNNTSHSETYITESGVTYENLNANGDVGTTSGTVCAGDDSRLSDLNTALNGKASKTESDLTFYVYEDATGDADGSSKANGFTTLQDAIDAIPDVAQNVTVIVSKGSTNYLGDTTTIQKASVKSLTIQGEFYAYEACDANAVAGKIVDASADFSDFEVGDRVVCTHYSGTVGSSSIDDYFYATITEVGEGYVQTSEETKVPTTGWRYLINQTVFDGDDTSDQITIKSEQTPIILLGVAVCNNGYYAVASYYASLLQLSNSIIYDTKYSVYGSTSDNLKIESSAIVNIRSGGKGVLNYAFSNIALRNTPISAVTNTNTTGINMHYAGTGGYVGFCGVFALKYAVYAPHTTSIRLDNCYIASSCTYGAYGYNITLSNCTNNAATPVTNLTSGGSIDQWDGQALPSIDDATGGQVLALKSDKSGLEFATVDLDTLGAASSTTATQNIYVDAAATGAETGVDWTNAFTTIQAAVDSLPAVINHAVTIKMRKADGSAYAAATLQRVVGAGSITIQGEYYYNNTVASAGSGTGKFNVIAGHSGLVQTGDKVLMIKYSGTVGASTPSDAFVDTVAGVSGTEITLTTRTSDAFSNSWRYVIVRTELAGLTVTLTDGVTVKGLFSNTTSGTPLVLNFAENAHLETVILQTTTSRCLTLTDSKWNAANTSGWQYIGFVNTSSGVNNMCVHLTPNTNIYGQNWVCLNAGSYTNTYGGTINGAPNWLVLNYCYIKATGTGCSYGVLCMGGKMSLGSLYIDGESSSYKMPVALYAEHGGFIRAASLTFGSNITTQKSPANWAASTDGSYIS